MEGFPIDGHIYLWQKQTLFRKSIIEKNAFEVGGSFSVFDKFKIWVEKLL